MAIIGCGIHYRIRHVHSAIEYCPRSCTLLGAFGSTDNQGNNNEVCKNHIYDAAYYSHVRPTLSKLSSCPQREPDSVFCPSNHATKMSVSRVRRLRNTVAKASHASLLLHLSVSRHTQSLSKDAVYSAWSIPLSSTACQKRSTHHLVCGLVCSTDTPLLLLCSCAAVAWMQKRRSSGRRPFLDRNISRFAHVVSLCRRTYVTTH